MHSAAGPGNHWFYLLAQGTSGNGQPASTTCNGSAAQTWRFQTDGTVRPLGNTALCLAAASTANNAAIQLATCNGAAL